MKHIKKIISVMLAVLIVFFCSASSMVTASAEEVTPSTTYDAAYFKNLFQKSGMDTTRFSLNSLTPDNYAVIVTQSLYDDNINFLFIPKTKENDFYIHKTYMSDDTFLNDYASLPLNNYPCIVGNTRGFGVKGHSTFSILGNSKYYHFTFNPQGDQYIDYGFRDDGDIYQRDFIDDGSLDKLPIKLIRQFLSKGIQRENIYVSDSNLYNLMSSTGIFTDTEVLVPTDSKSILRYAPNLLASLNSIFGGYTGEILDTSVAGMINEYGIEAPSTIYDDYKNKLYYMQNNDLSMVFMNNAEAPSYKKEDYSGIYEGAKKYTFTYAKTYDAIVYFPQYQKYLKFDDWWNSNSKGGIDWGAWGNFGIIDVITSTNDKSKTFYLISDWDVTFNDTGGSSYAGTRVIMSWDNEYGETLDSNTMMKPWEDNSETLKNQGWQDGRPNDMSYPYCVQYYLNGVPSMYIYMNAKPKVNVCRYSDSKCSYALEMVGTYGYFYDVMNDMYHSFDFTMVVDIGNPYGDNAFNDLASVLNDWFDSLYAKSINMFDDGKLMMWENYKEDNTYYVGSKVFFNWDIRSNWYQSNSGIDDYDYSGIILKDGNGFIDNNGNGHGGDTSNYTDDELNKYNDNGNKEEIEHLPSMDNFNFTVDSIFSYCADYLKFIKYIFDLFPGWIWVLLGVSIAIIVPLRVLGR